MNIEGKTFLLTGANGGIGSAIAEALAEQGACLVLAGMEEAALLQLRDRIVRHFRGDGHRALVVNLTTAEGLQKLVSHCENSPIDGLINAAGIADFSLFSELSADRLQLAINLNLLAPMQLIHALLPELRKRKESAIVNIGSTFGSIGYPGYAAYCASKAGLRGFSEALGRELADTNVHVHYLAPRAVDTPINSDAVVAMNRKLGNAVDQPEDVADQVLALLQRRRSSSVYMGWPEKLFVRVNGLVPGIVDKSIRKQLPTIKQFANF